MSIGNGTRRATGLRGHKEIFREDSICAHAILSDEVLVVGDASEDPRFARLPIVAGKTRVRFYAGAPLKTRDGYRLGTLCVMDRRPRLFDKADKKALADLAAIVIDELTLRRVVGHLHTEVNGRKHNEKILNKQHRLLQRLSVSQEDSIRQRTAELTRVNDSLRAEIRQREQFERDRLNLLGLVEESPDFIGLATFDAIPLYVNEAGPPVGGARQHGRGAPRDDGRLFSPRRPVLCLGNGDGKSTGDGPMGRGLPVFAISRPVP